MESGSTGTYQVLSLNLLTTYRIVGFDDLGNTDNFTTAHLEYRLIETGLDLETLLSNDQQEWYQDREWREKARQRRFWASGGKKMVIPRTTTVTMIDAIPWYTRCSTLLFALSPVSLRHLQGFAFWSNIGTIPEWPPE